ncbi:MAG: hypothetical protein KKD39_02020 [Candidatus Altiarchaeota archaeon]|nr:hypothetical protein [Candidatus Altiarchaeota archaeon]
MTVKETVKTSCGPAPDVETLEIRRHLDPVFRTMSPEQVSESSQFLPKLVTAGHAYAGDGRGLNGFRYDPVEKKINATVGINPMEVRTVRFLKLKDRRYSQHLIDAFGFPFHTDQDATIPFWGNIYMGGKKATEEQLKQLGIEVVKNPDGTDKTYEMTSYRYRRKLYLPGEFQFVVVKAHETAPGNPPSTIIHPRHRIVSDPRILESHIRHFEPSTSEETIKKLHAEAHERITQQHSTRGVHEDLKTYLGENLTHEYILTLGEYVEKRHHTAEVRRGCAITFGGTGSEYYGHLERIKADGKPTMDEGEVVTITGELATQLSDKGVFVGKKQLVEAKANGAFLDEAHQPEFSGVPIGVCGVEENGRVERDKTLMEEGAALSEITVDVIPLIEKHAVDRVFTPQKMAQQMHPSIDDGTETPSLYVPVTIVVDDTRRLHEVTSNPLTYMKYVTERYLEVEDRRKAAEIIAKLEKEGVKKPDKPSPVTALVKYQGGDPGEVEVEGLNPKEVLLLNLMYATARKKHIEALSRNIGANMRAAIKANLAERKHAEIIQNLSPEGARADTGDFRKTSSPGERMDAIAQSVNTVRQYMLADTILPQVGGVTKDQENLFQLWVGALLQTVEKTGLDPIAYLRSHEFKQFMVQFLGGAEARNHYHRANTQIETAFAGTRNIDMGTAVQMVGGVMRTLFNEFNSQQEGEHMMDRVEALQQSPLAKKTSAVNSTKAHTEYGLEHFTAADGTKMVTPSQFTGAFDQLIGEFQSLPESFYRHSWWESEDERREYFRRTQQRMTRFLDDSIGMLAGEKNGFEAVGWEKTYVFRHAGGELYGGNDWENKEPHRPGEEIHLVTEPTEDRRTHHLSDKMIDIMYADDEIGQKIGPERNDRRLAAEILKDLRRTLTEFDWGNTTEERVEDLVYAYDKTCEIRRLFERREPPLRSRDTFGLMSLGLFSEREEPVNDYHGGETDYMYGKIEKPGERQRRERQNRYRYDWLDI